jgi:hypothetical protein
MKFPFAAIAILTTALNAADTPKPFLIHETFDAPFDASRFTTPIPNKYTEVRDGVLWTRGSSGGKYPPMVYLPVEGTDLTISFRYRHLAAGGWIWFFVDGDDGFGSVDHLLRMKLLPWHMRAYGLTGKCFSMKSKIPCETNFSPLPPSWITPTTQVKETNHHVFCQAKARDRRCCSADSASYQPS